MCSFSTTYFPCALQVASVWRMLFLNNTITTITADGQWPRGSVTTTETLWDKHRKKEKRAQREEEEAKVEEEEEEDEKEEDEEEE